MKKFSLLVLFLLMPVWALAVTFPVTSPLVSSEETPGVVKVTGSPADLQSVNYLVQFCPDVLRSGCANNIVIPASENGGSYKTFQLDREGVADGQVAYNFIQAKGWKPTWLHIPSCLVSAGANTAFEMSYRDESIEDSGGAHFISTANGYRATYPISSGGNCGESAVSVRAPAPPAPRPVAIAKVQTVAAAPCDPCEKIAEVKQDTVAIRQSVGDVDPADPPEQKTIQQKTRKILNEVGTSKSSVSLHDKIGEPKKAGDTLMAKVEKIEQAVEVKGVGGTPWWAWTTLLGLVILGLLCFLRRRNGHYHQ